MFNTFHLNFQCRSGFRGITLVEKMGKTMLQSGMTFGTFMGIGAALRC